jgi:hypothetical protein
MLGVRFFTGGLILMALFAFGHLSGFIAAVHAARHDPGMADLTRAMRAHRTKLLGFNASLQDFREYFSLNFSILLLLASGLGFATLAIMPDRPVAVHTLSPVYAGAMILLLGTSVRYSIAQGVVTCPTIAILFGLAWWFA